MSLLRGHYVGARSCTGSAKPGNKALMAWYLGAYADDGAANLGIYFCKSIAGTRTTSLHGEGRADDLGSRPYRTLPFMAKLADAFVANSHELGIQCVIHHRRIWSSLYPDAGWRYYGGENHDGHLHVELTPEAARTLTVATLNRVLGAEGVNVHPPHPTKPTPRPPSGSAPDFTRRIVMALPQIEAGRGLNGTPDEDVQTMQNLLQARGYRSGIDANGGADGRWGKGTTSDLKAFQKAKGLEVDGICGPKTWAHLLRQPGAVA